MTNNILWEFLYQAMGGYTQTTFANHSPTTNISVIFIIFTVINLCYNSPKFTIKISYE